jgi:hypothetical protein
MKKEHNRRETPVRNKEKAKLDKKIDQMMKRVMPQLPHRLNQLARKIEHFDVRKPATLNLGGHLKTGHTWSLQNRPMESGRDERFLRF